MLVLLPRAISGIILPEGFRAVVFDAQRQELDEETKNAEFYVPAYMGDSRIFEVVSEMPKLKYVQLLTAGIDKTVGYIPPGVTLMNARGVHDSSTAELALALALASLRNLTGYIRAGSQAWSARSGRPSLYAKEVAIIGAGSIGREIARIFGALGARCTLVSRTGSGGSMRLDQSGALLADADVVVLVVPLTEATRQLADAAFLANLKDGALFVNVARGEVADTEALLAEVSSGRIAAALDVTDPEPLPSDHPLWNEPNCLISPHVGGATDAFIPKARELVEKNLARIAAGERPLNVIEGDY
ncbi:MAG: NAD(P)-dependent oxidoreductase [Actinomycetota bacterium]|nr:NAD(P)-dependent oxidoreductase [Actinomycetota bacterium]